MSSLPSYVTAAKPVPLASRASWYKTIAPTYAGIMLWFVFWQDIAKGYGTPGGVLSAGLGAALLGLVVAALLCHFCFYLVPGLLGMRTGLPLYVVGTSTYGALGGRFMPGLLMGLLQFGWLAVNAWAVAQLFCASVGWNAAAPSLPHGAVATVFAVLCAFIGLKGIKYVARVATYLPLIPLVVLVILLVKTWGGLEHFSPEKIMAAAPQGQLETAPLASWQVLVVLSIYVVGFFATAGAAGADIASNGRNTADVQIGGLTGITLATIIAGGGALLIIAGAYGGGLVKPDHLGHYNPLEFMPDLLGARMATAFKIALAISSIPPACVSAFIAANSFKTTMPKVNPFISVGFGTLVAVVLAVTGWVAQVIWVFVVIGASFGPVCGAMAADYLLSGRKWAGPRAGFNPAGWISWIVGFAVGAADFIPGMAGKVPCPPVAAFLVGFVLYVVLASLGMQSKKLEMPETAA